MHILPGVLALAMAVAVQGGPPRVLTPDQAREDLAALKRGLEEMHGGLYRFATKEELDARFAAMATAFDASIPLVDFYGAVLEAAAWPRDGHI